MVAHCVSVSRHLGETMANVPQWGVHNLTPWQIAHVHYCWKKNTISVPDEQHRPLSA